MVMKQCSYSLASTFGPRLLEVANALFQFRNFQSYEYQPLYLSHLSSLCAKVLKSLSGMGNFGRFLNGFVPKLLPLYKRDT
jgi:hypothetical protein